MHRILLASFIFLLSVGSGRAQCNTTHGFDAWTHGELTCIPGADCYCVLPFVQRLQQRTAAPPLSNGDVTVLTHFSASKLLRLKALAQEWTGPISAVYYVAGVGELQLALASLADLALPSTVTTHVVVRAQPKGSYPINLLRTIAQRYARTHLVLMLDIDFQPSYRLHDALRSSEYAHVWANAKLRTAFVVPAFEFKMQSPCTGAAQYAHTAGEMTVTGHQPHRCMPSPASKAALSKAVQHRWARVFHSHFPGHHFTDTARWMNATAPYYINWGTFYEPYVLLNKSLPDFPEYDARFVDRGMNKVIFTAQLHARGFRFVVLPNAFVTHVWETKLTEKKTRLRHNMRLRGELYSTVMGEERLRRGVGVLGNQRDDALLPEYLPYVPIATQASKAAHE